VLHHFDGKGFRRSEMLITGTKRAVFFIRRLFGD
jgi:hypothetical protein